MGMESKAIVDNTAIVEGTNHLSEGSIIGPYCSVNNVKLGKDAKLMKYVNAYGCEIGQGTKVGSFVEIQSDVKVGKNVTICSHSFLCSLVTISDDVFIGHNVMTINDLHPPSRKRTGKTDEWKPTHIGQGSVIGSNTTLLPVKIGKYAEVGAGSVVTKDVPDYAIVVGNPAKVLRIKEKTK